MKIISKDSDYYDSCTAFGQSDDNYVFARNKKTHLLQEVSAIEVIDKLLQLEAKELRKIFRDISRRNTWGTRYSDPFIEVGVLIFCGKNYPLITFCSEAFHQFNTTRTGLEKVIEYMSLNGVKSEREMPYLTFYDAVSAKRFITNMSNLGAFKDADYGEAYWFDIIERIFNAFKPTNDSDFYRQLLVNYNTPYLKVHRINYNFQSCSLNIETNTNLRLLQFQKQFYPQQAYQEIEMFCCGVLGSTQEEIIQIADEHLRDAKGFDGKSFKTRPGTKKRRKHK
ncbi:hypothetical protein B9J93_03850 [Vibrio sp. V17_P4S1T151]|uniref:hypothetical protein n=1 Tax=unclassified Vibrio TaxID=2614977 RepID=UPI000B8EAA73|nr:MULTISPECIES: hypothetical protein [unclassified Vibrio]OXX48835.1 hypothetical protein B9J93_03850 [Vibrio sp. V17_P4S1T151]OXX64628.1 hypothetical protein B9J89_01730 [Vibrio sp. V15_P4S5T153]